MTRRELLRYSGQIGLAAGLAPVASALVESGSVPASGAMRCLNVVNFIRGVEPRFETDLLLPVQKQMEIIRAHDLPATWLLQFDALVAGPFVEYLKAHMPKGHEVGFWFEMNEMHCRAAGVEWRGRPGFEWDHFPLVAFTIGYTPEERIKLADTAMTEFKRIWGETPKSVASWNLDAITMAHLTETYGVDAYAVCRDQIATDGFTIWGAPIAGYYPSKTNAWSPALDRKNQISTPVFRMLGQDPVYYYDNRSKLPGGKVVREPDTMEPVWTSGKSPVFVREFLRMIAETPTVEFGYAQLGQENSFPWREMAEAYAPQMEALAALRKTGSVHVETMGDSGRRFKSAFRTTPVQSQVQLNDPFGNTDAPEGSIWYQSRFYRANLHLRDGLPYLRDLTVYNDAFEQPFLRTATRQHEVQQRMLSVIDGYHWSTSPGSLTELGAGGFFEVDGERVRLAGPAKVRQNGKTLFAELPITDRRSLVIRFEESAIVLRLVTERLSAERPGSLTLVAEFDVSKSPSLKGGPFDALYRFEDFFYAVRFEESQSQLGPGVWRVAADQDEIRLRLDQRNTVGR